MRILTAIGTLFFASSTLSQITLTQSDFGNAGDTVRLSISSDLMVDFSATGENYSWDFGQLSPTSQYLKEYSSILQSGFGAFLFGPFAPDQYQASYYTDATALSLDQLGQFLPINITGYYAVDKLENTGLTTVGYLLGVEDNLLAVRSDTTELRYPLPLYFGDSFSSTGYTELDLQPFYNGAWIQHKSRTSLIDGYGQLNTPYGIFDVLRIKNEIIEDDSVLIDFNGTSYWLPLPVPLTREYEWWANGEKYPILRIVTSEVFGNEVITRIEYKDVYRGLDAGMEDQELKVSIGPNPTEGFLTVRAEQPIDHIQIIQSDGRIVRNFSGLKIPEVTLDLEDFSEGHYFVKTCIGDKVSRLPFVLR